MYFLRLAKLKPTVEELARTTWDKIEVGPLCSLRRGLGELRADELNLDRWRKDKEGGKGVGCEAR